MEFQKGKISLNQEKLTKVNALYVIQNADKIARKADYVHLSDELLVHGIFATLQGEGPYAGTPCVFLRLAGCNFGDKKSGACAFCDTDFKLENGKVKDFSAIIDEIQEAWEGAGIPEDTWKLIVITGGEPGLQPPIVDFIRHANSEGWYVQVETNGTQNDFAKKIEGYVNEEDSEEDQEYNPVKGGVTLVVSPKAGINGYGHLDVGSWQAANGVLKLIVEARSDSPHHEIPEFAREWKLRGGDVYVSPIAVYLKEYKGEVSDAWEDGLLNKELTRSNYRYAAELALKNGYKLSIQQHLFAAIA